MKKIRLLALAVLLVLTLTGCDLVNELGSKVEEIRNDIISGDVTGEIGKTYSTQWFDFSVNAIERVDQYQDQVPAEGMQFIKAEIFEKSTYDKAIPMGTFDFFVDHDSFDEYIWPMDPWHDSMMPAEFELNKGDSVTYTLIFEVPADIETVDFYYV